MPRLHLARLVVAFLARNAKTTTLDLLVPARGNAIEDGRRLVKRRGTRGAAGRRRDDAIRDRRLRELGR